MSNMAISDRKLGSQLDYHWMSQIYEFLFKSLGISWQLKKLFDHFLHSPTPPLKIALL